MNECDLNGVHVEIEVAIPLPVVDTGIRHGL